MDGQDTNFLLHDGPWNLLNCSEKCILVTRAKNDDLRSKTATSLLGYNLYAHQYNAHIKPRSVKREWLRNHRKLYKKLLWTCPLVLNCTKRRPYYNLAETTGKRTGWLGREMQHQPLKDWNNSTQGKYKREKK